MTPTPLRFVEVFAQLWNDHERRIAAIERRHSELDALKREIGAAGKASARSVVLEAAVELDQIARDFKRCSALANGTWLDPDDRKYHASFVNLAQRLRTVAEEMPR